MDSFLRRIRAAHYIDWPAAGLLAALLVLLVGRVGTPVLHVWDEARLAVSAAEMLRSGDWLVVRYEGQPDLWSPKPPLLIWLQAASLHWLGYSTWATRLPSVLAALGTAWCIYRFGRYTLGSRFTGIFAALILATSPGFNGTHVARYGDYDALLTLGLTAAALHWYRYAQQRQPGQLWRGAGWLALALLTKSAAAVLLLPAVGLALLLDPAGRWVFGQWHTYGAVAAAFGPLALFYGLREQAAPGYLAAIWLSEWYGRLRLQLAATYFPWWTYLQRLFFPGLLTWSWLLPVGGWLGVSAAAAAAPTRRFARFASVYIVVFLVILSAARTRLAWYSAPVYPMAALLCALGLTQLTRQALRAWRWPRPVVAGLLVLALGVPAGVLLRHEWGRWEAEKADASLWYGYQLPHVLALRPRLRTFTILAEHRYQATLHFYVAGLRQQGIQAVVLTTLDADLRHFQPGQVLLVSSAALQRSLHQRYRTQALPFAGPGALLRILGRHPETEDTPTAGNRQYR